MSEFGEVIAADSVRFERILPGPIERVWGYLVDPDKRARWFCGGKTESAVGGHVEMHLTNASLSTEPDDPPPEKYSDLPEKMSFSGTVTVYDPPNHLAHTWDFEGESSEVSYQLSEQDDQVRLVLTHRRLKSREEMISVCGGWHTHLDILRDVLQETSPQPFWKRHSAIEDEYETRLPSS